MNRFLRKLVTVRYTTEGLPPPLEQDGRVWSVAGRCRGLTVVINPAWRGNVGLLEHELGHAEVNIYTLGFGGLFRLFKRFRIWDEARSYAIQLRFPNGNGEYPTVLVLAERLASPTYKFGLTAEQAVGEITKHI